MSKIINIGIIGCGHWGPNYVRVLNASPSAIVKVVYDLDEIRLNDLKKNYPQLKVTTNNKEFYQNNIDAVIICTPAKTHFDLVKEAFSYKKHVLCEKPLTLRSEEALELKNLSKKKNLIIMVGNIFLFNTGINLVKKYIKNNLLGKPVHMNSIRTNLGPIRKDVNVVYDLASHDISIFNYFLDQKPIEVSAIGVCRENNKIEDCAFINLKYLNNIIVNIQVSWLSPQKVRRITIVGEKKMVSWDDLDNIGPIKIYHKAEIEEPYYSTFGEFQLLSRDGNIQIPEVNLKEPLNIEVDHFIDVINRRKENRCNINQAIDIIKILEAINASINSSGSPIKID